MPDKLYLWRTRVRGYSLWCHAPSNYDAIQILTKQVGEPLEEYCLEWEVVNLDGSPITDAERDALWGLI